MSSAFECALEALVRNEAQNVLAPSDATLPALMLNSRRSAYVVPYFADLILTSSAHSPGQTEAYLSMVKRFEELEQTAVASIRRALAQAGAQVNDFSPVHWLSDDVLVLIFELLPCLALFNASQTCSRWRSVSLAAPVLWSKLNFPWIDARFVRRSDLMISRAAQIPLDASVSACGDFLSEDEQEDEDRVAQASAEAQKDMDRLAAFLNPNTCSRLRQLRVDYFHTVPPEDELFMFLEACPRLESLVWQWESPVTPLELHLSSLHGAFASLTRVFLSNIEDSIGILVNIPNLVHLRLDLPFRASWETDDLDIDIAEILQNCPRLENFHLHDIDSEGIKLIFLPETGSDLQRGFPETFRHLELRGEKAHAAVTTLNSSCNVLVGLPSLVLISYIDVDFSAEPIFEHVGGSDAHFYARAMEQSSGQTSTIVHVHGTNGLGISRSMRVRTSLPGTLPSQAISCTTLTLNLTFLMAAGFPTVLPNVTTLHLQASYEQIQSVAISTTVHLGVSVPALRTLSLFLSFDAQHTGIASFSIKDLVKHCFEGAILPLERIEVFADVPTFLMDSPPEHVSKEVVHRHPE